jgi:hypothetical protein
VPTRSAFRLHSKDEVLHGSGHRSEAGDAGDALARADLLERTLTLHTQRPQEHERPVRKTTDVLDAAWAEQATAQIAMLREQAAVTFARHAKPCVKPRTHPRAAVFLVRRAWEEHPDAYVRRNRPDLERCSMPTKTVWLAQHLDSALADRLAAGWYSLSGVCHHQQYAMAPTIGDPAAGRTRSSLSSR